MASSSIEELDDIGSLIPLVIQMPIQILEKLVAPDGAHLPDTRPVPDSVPAVPDSCRFSVPWYLTHPRQ